MTEARIARLNSLIAQLRSIGPHSNGQNKFILDESPLDNQNQASSSSSRIFIGRLQPNSGIYTQGSILIHIELGPAFPFKPPRVCLRTKVFHPNVSEQGES